MLLANKLEKIPDPRNAKEHCQSFIRKKNNTKSVNQLKVITYEPKTFEIPNIVDIKSIITEHQKTSHKLSKTIRQAKKVGSNSPLYSDTKRVKIFWKIENIKITKRAHPFKAYSSSYNVEILNCFNPELQLKDTESAIKSKFIELLTKLQGFKFVATLTLVFKNIESEDKTKYGTFYSSSKAEIIINKGVIDDVFQSIYTIIISDIQNL